jgi:DNA polymerase III subunit alpha
MLKMDFLGLKTLTVIEEAERWVRQKEPGFSTSTIRLDNVPTFELIKRGETVAVFQMESGGMVNTCRQLGPDKIEEIIAILALYRPGPMQFIPLYIARKKGEEQVNYEHPLLEQIAAETYGILVYQEQVMQAASLLAGYSLGQADMLRRAMGKKKAEEMAKQRETFVTGCKVTNDIPEPKAHEIFGLLEKFAEYGFNKSHSAAYGIVTYRTAYLKANYPVEFMSGVLSLEVSNTDKIANFVSECQRMGIEILPPDVNESALVFSPAKVPDDRKAIRYGLSAIKNVGSIGMEQAIAEREANGPFKSLEDFTTRIDSKQVSKRSLECLVQTGAFDFTGETRRSMFQRLDQVIAGAASAQKDRRSGQGTLFDFDFAAAAPTPPPAPKEPEKKSRKAAPPEEPKEWTKMELIAFERELLGFYVSGHPLDAYRGHFGNDRYFNIGGIEEITEKKTITVAGLLNSVDIRYSKKDNRPFATLKIEDFTGSIEAMCWSDTYEKVKDFLAAGAVVAMRSTCEKDQRTEMNRLTARDIKLLQPKKGRPPSVEDLTDPNAGPMDAPADDDERTNSEPPAPKALVLRLDVNQHTEDDLIDLQKTLMQHPGTTPVHLRCQRFDGSIVLLELSTDYRVAQTRSLVAALSHWLC